MHDGFDFWIADVEDPDGTRPPRWSRPTPPPARRARLTSVEAAYWTDVGTSEHLRWVMPHDEEPLLDALARLHVAGKDVGRRGSRLRRACSGRTACSCRCGTCPSGTGAEVLEEPVAQLSSTTWTRRSRTTAPLTAEERAARGGLANRQLTIR